MMKMAHIKLQMSSNQLLL